MEIENLGNSEEVLEVITHFEPSLSEKMQEYAHPSFNKLFFKFEEENENICVYKVDRNYGTNLYLQTTLYTENEQIVDFEYEIDKEKYFGRENYAIPQMISSHKAFSKNIVQVVNPIIAMKRTIKVPAKENVSVNLILSVSENKQTAIQNLENMKSEEEIIRTMNIARVRGEEESKYLQVTSEKLESYFELLNYILRLNNLKNITSVKYANNSFWKYGLTGDFPIVLVKIKNIEDIYVVEEVIDAYEYFRAKNIQIDLIILNEESNVYERFIKENIEEVISNKQLGYLKNVSTGITILNKNEVLDEDICAYEFKANVVIDASNGGINHYLKEQEEKKKTISQNIVRKENLNSNKEVLPLKKENLLYDNGFGGFSEDGKEYVIYKNKENKLPAPWCNVLANKFFGTIISDNLGGYTWSRNSRLNRITAWNNDACLDFPSEIFYVKNEDSGNIWTLNTGILPNDNYYYIRQGFGYFCLKNINDNFSQNLEIFVPNNEKFKVLKFNIKNLINNKRKLKILMYLKVVLGEDEILTNGNLKSEKKENIIFIENNLKSENFKEILYVMSSEKIKSFTGEKDNFFGEGDVFKPDAMYRSLNFSSGVGKDSCVGIEIELDFNGLENKEFNIIIGTTQTKDKVYEVGENYFVKENVNLLLEETKKDWNNILERVKIFTPSDSLNIIMNGWLVYQTINSRLLGRTGFYQSGGAFGFRDQLQDGIGMLYVNSSYLEEQIRNCARHQFIEGDVLHWWHQETKRGIRTKFSDDLLWLVYGTIEYINFKNDMSILDEKIEYLKGDILDENQDEKYDIFYESDVKESLFNHCVRAIENTISKGIDPFPKIGSGDWNDGFNNIGKNGKGESIWLAFFLYDILKKFIVICENRGENELAKKYKEINQKLKKNLNTKGWDGRWFKRAINYDGVEIGSMSSDECRIDSLSQSWAIISDAADNDKKYIAISEAENYLIDKENKIVKLFDPPFEKSKINPGYIKFYPPGIRENGGQYTHAACWLMIAEAMLGFGDKAFEIANIINPIEHSKTKEEAKRFKLEPYIMEADLYSNKDLLGRGGWNWYTGSSSWYYKGVLEYILGFKIENGYIKIEPCIPKEWKEYQIEYKYKTSLYKIKIKNKDGKNTGIQKIILNDEELSENKIPLKDNSKIYNIEIYM